jgi:predicted O-methyltransferase YrrM
VNYLDCKDVLELGTSLGIATSTMAGNKSAKVITLEGCPETANIAQQQFNKFGLNNIDLKIGKFEDTLEEVESGKKREKKENRNQEAGDKKVESGEWREESGERKEARDKKQATREWRVESGEANHKLRTPNQKRRTKNDEPKTTNQKLQTPNYKLKKFDLVFFDGNHQKQPTLEYFHKLLPTAKNNSVFVFDDIHWSPQMEEAWEEIINHPEVTVSIDTFYWGLIFFRKEQAKQHFNIRL